MVIQRSWKILSDAGSTSASSTEANRSPSGLHSSSDDSNCSNQTTHSMVTSASMTSPNAITKLLEAPSTSANTETYTKYITTPQMAEVMLHRLRLRLGSNAVSTSGVNSESALHSLELLRISVQSAFDKEVDTVIKRFVENYFKPACNNIKENLGQNAVTDDMLLKMSSSLLENAKAQYNNTRYIIGDNNLRQAIKRAAAKSHNIIEHAKKPFPNTGAIPTQQQGTITIEQPKPINTSLTSQQSTLLPQKAPTTQATQVKRQIFWNTAHISTTTKFVLDVQANQAFGFGTDGKERLASKHPELIRYLPDSEDRDWLITQNIISQQNRNSRFLFLIYDEVGKLRQTHEIYKTKLNVDLSVMHTFTVPEFMIQKMKLFFVDLNIKSRGLITNSFSVGIIHGNSHLRNALLQGAQSVSTSKACTTSTAVNTTSGAEISTSVSNDTIEINEGQAAKSSNKASSALSSSHATLTALLNNPQQHCPINPHVTAASGGEIAKSFAVHKMRK